jgi:hypothetical protein
VRQRGLLLWAIDCFLIRALHPQIAIHDCCRVARALVKLLATVLAAVAIGATAAAMHAAINSLVGWRNTILQRFYSRSLLQVNLEPMRHMHCRMPPITRNAIH